MFFTDYCGQYKAVRKKHILLVYMLTEYLTCFRIPLRGHKYSLKVPIGNAYNSHIPVSITGTIGYLFK